MASTFMMVVALVVMILAFNESLPALYVIMLALFNDIASAAFAYDHAVPTLGPSIPSLKSLMTMATVLGLAIAIESLAMFKYGYVPVQILQSSCPA